MTRTRKRKVAPPVQPEHPWDRQPQETDNQWGAFVAYRDLGPNDRSLAKAALKIGKHKRNLEQWCQSWDWVARCAAFDSWVDRQARAIEVAEIREMRKRHVQASMSLQGAGLLALNKIIAAERKPLLDANGQVVKDAAGNPVPGELTLKPNEVKDLIELGTKLERLTRGEPGEIETLTVTPASAPPPIVHDYSNLSTEELRTLRALARKARGDA